ncbi:hypothetical protein QJQ45_006623 [Haematococcus lacustris]|nr:hypothetical protein QJQ45_006623 [Haematococcus lacustris]
MSFDRQITLFGWWRAPVDAGGGGGSVVTPTAALTASVAVVAVLAAAWVARRRLLVRVGVLPSAAGGSWSPAVVANSEGHRGLRAQLPTTAAASTKCLRLIDPRLRGLVKAWSGPSLGCLTAMVG